MQDSDRETIQAIAETAAKLLAETRRLRLDVVRLHGRIEPFDGEVLVREAPGYVDALDDRKSWRLVDALETIKRARREIVSAEHGLNAVRGRIDEIAADAYLRDELKPFILPPFDPGKFGMIEIERIAHAAQPGFDALERAAGGRHVSSDVSHRQDDFRQSGGYVFDEALGGGRVGGAGHQAASITA